MTQAMQLIDQDAAIRHTLIVDSKKLFHTVTTLEDGRDYQLKQIFQLIGYSFEVCEIDELR